MKLVFGYANTEGGELGHPGPNVFTRELTLNGFDAATCASLRRIDPDCIVLRLDGDELASAHRWALGMLERGSLRRGVHLICLAREDMPSAWSESRPGDACPMYVVKVGVGQSAERLALRRAEEIASAQTRVWLSCLPRERNRRVVLVGAGIVNLVTAVYLHRAGYSVSIVEGGPPPGAAAAFPRCTWSGGDGRIFSWNEARHHLRGRTPAAALRPFRRAISDGGWLCAAAETLTPVDQQWIERHEQTAAWLRDVYHDDIIATNRDSDPCWWRLFREIPEVFADVGLQPRLFRVYPDERRLELGEREERAIGAFKRRLESLRHVASELPELGEAIHQGNIGGALEVRGFGLNIHRFASALVSYLQSRGVEIAWNTYVQRMKLDAVGNVEGVWAGSRFFEADHYVLSTGVAGGPLLSGSMAGPQLASMLGVWVSVPQGSDARLPPLKVCRDGFASDESAAGANVIPGRAADGTPVLNISAGHGFLGENVQNVDERQVAALFRAVEETACSLFPRAARSAQASGWLMSSRSRCIRPWTPTCLGIFETRPTSTGGVFVIAGGHNTGGFAQSPAVAQAVLAALDGRPHAMHRKYHPERLDAFVGAPVGAPVALEAAS